MDDRSDSATSAYECLRCGEITTADGNHLTCPECGGSGLQNRARPLE